MTEKYQLNQFFAKKLPFYLIIMGCFFLILAFTSPILNKGEKNLEKENYSQIIPNNIKIAASGSLEVSTWSRFLHSYLFSFSFYMSIVWGAFFFVLLQFLTRAEWSVVIRRIPENLMKNTLLMTLLSLPILLGVFQLFEWTHQDIVAKDHLLIVKAPYLNLSFFYFRMLFYFLGLFLISNYYYKASVKQDQTNDNSITLKLQKSAPLSMFFFAIAITFFAVDLLMSLFPHWYSTMWGVYYFAGSTVSFFSVTILIALLLRSKGILKDVITVEHYHDLGKLLFAFNVFWSYIAFSQYLLIWYANIPEETIFYINRINGAWFNVSVLLIVGHIFLPIILFVSRNAKRNLIMQFLVAIWLLFMQIVDLYWVIMPVVDKISIQIIPEDLFIFLGIGGLFFGCFFRNLGKQAIVPYNDFRFKESIKFENF